MMDQISRVISGKTGPRNDGYSAHHSSTFKVTGRHTLNIWRICRSEINLTQYTFENVVFHLLHQRIPHYSPASLTALWKSKSPSHACRVLKYFFQRTVMCMEILDQAEIITKTAWVNLRGIIKHLFDSHLQGICSRVWSRLRLCLDSRLSVQSWIIHLPYCQAWKLCISIPFKTAGRWYCYLHRLPATQSHRSVCKTPHLLCHSLQNRSPNITLIRLLSWISSHYTRPSWLHITYVTRHAWEELRCSKGLTNSVLQI